MITDKQRWKWLESRGYLPDAHPVFVCDTEAVNWAIEQGHCPAYWRPWTPLDPATSNGMVFVRRGDRDRIDQSIAKGQD